MVKELQTYQEPLQKLLVRLKLVSQAETQYACFVPDLEKSTKELDAYIEASLSSIWQFEALPMDKAAPQSHDIRLHHTDRLSSGNHALTCRICLCAQSYLLQ